MAITSHQLKTLKREVLTDQYPDIHDCVIHKKKPEVLHIVAGKRKESHYIVTCGHDECVKLSMSNAEEVVYVWNRYNPIPLPKNR